MKRRIRFLITMESSETQGEERWRPVEGYWGSGDNYEELQSASGKIRARPNLEILTEVDCMK